MNIPIGTNNQVIGGSQLPNVNSVMPGWFQPMEFLVVTKTIQAGQVIESGSTVAFQGVMQPLTPKELMIKPEGERDWTWLWLHADPSLTLQNDDCVIYNGTQLRVMTVKDYTAYGYVEYTLIEDTTGGGPTITGGT